MQEYSEHFSIGQAAHKLGVSVVTLRRWDALGKLKSSFRKFGGHRRFSAYDVLNIISNKKRINICSARVSSHDQKKDLETQANFLGRYYDEKSIDYKIIKVLGSGLNFKKKGLNKLLMLILNREADTVFVSNKDRLLRFGSELIVKIAGFMGIKVVFLEKVESTFDQQLAKDVLEIITVFSARLYGSRSHKKKTLTANLSLA